MQRGRLCSCQAVCTILRQTRPVSSRKNLNPRPFSQSRKGPSFQARATVCLLRNPSSTFDYNPSRCLPGPCTVTSTFINGTTQSVPEDCRAGDSTAPCPDVCATSKDTDARYTATRQLSPGFTVPVPSSLQCAHPPPRGCAPTAKLYSGTKTLKILSTRQHSPCFACYPSLSLTLAATSLRLGSRLQHYRAKAYSLWQTVLLNCSRWSIEPATPRCRPPPSSPRPPSPSYSGLPGESRQDFA
jgi:hypothetical protein